MYKEKSTKPVCLLLVATALSMTGNMYAEIAPANPRMGNIAQDEGQLTGTVSDAMGPVVGATILIKGTTHGTITDMDGHFVLNDLKRGDVIQISYIGYTTQEITYEGQPSLEIMLAEDSEQLDEVVVTALGMKRAEVGSFGRGIRPSGKPQ